MTNKELSPFQKKIQEKLIEAEQKELVKQELKVISKYYTLNEEGVMYYDGEKKLWERYHYLQDILEPDSLF